MIAGASALRAAVRASLDRLPNEVNHLVVAFSGGIDSVALLQLLQDFRDRYRLSLWHVHHGLQVNADDMAALAKSRARILGIECRIDHLDLDARDSNLEAKARDARYRLFASAMDASSALLTAHHLDDQAETLLLNLMRGSGPSGLAGIADLRSLGPGWLLRPLLGVSRASIREFVSGQGLDWVEDPSNAETHCDRNFLRHRVLPLLQERWLAAADQLARSAQWQGETADLLQQLAEIDASGCLVDSPFSKHACVHVPGLLGLNPTRRGNLLRHWLRTQAGITPGRRQLAEILRQSKAREDAQPRIPLSGAEARRHGDLWFLLVEGDDGPDWGKANRLPPGQWLGYRPELGRHPRWKRKARRLMQEAGVPPWLRDRVPLLFDGERLVGLWLERD